MEEKNVGINESSEKKSFWGERTIYIVAIAILLLVHFCTGKKEQTPTQQPKENSTLLKRENDSLKHANGTLQKKAYAGIKWHWVAADLMEENADLKKRNAHLLDSIGKMNHRKVALDSTETNLNGRKGMAITGKIVLADLPGDSTIFVAYPTCKSDSVLKENVVKKYTISLVKNQYSKKGKIETVTQTMIGDYSSLVNFSGNAGFSKDVYFTNYTYMNEKGDSANFKFKSVLEGNMLKVNADQDGANLLSQSKEFELGLAGLNHMNSQQNPFSSKWESRRYWEKIVDPNKLKRGNREFWPGLALIAAGGTGTWYYYTNPEATLSVTSNGKSLLGINVPNGFAKVVCPLATAAGVYLTIKGAKDKKMSWIFTPVSFGLNVNLK